MRQRIFMWLDRVAAVLAVRHQEQVWCPAVTQAGPGRRTVVQTWVVGTWGWPFLLADTARRRFGGRGYRHWGGRWFPKGQRKPRTCSYCGGVHPDDAIALVEAGWTLQATGKPYKRYLQPPGYQAAVATWRTAEPVGGAWPRLPDLPALPIPPVKLYTWHLDTMQARRLTDLTDPA